MNFQLLLDAIVRQTTVLVAQLATAGGGRAPLAHTANQVFLELVRELKEQGLGNKVIADMFGVTLRTYHNRISRLAESSTVHGRSVWEAVLSHVTEKGPILRTQVLFHFAKDDPETVKGVLRDLVDSGLIYRTGRGDSVIYRVGDETLELHGAGRKDERTGGLLWVAIFRHGPLTRTKLQELFCCDSATIEPALAALLADQRVRATPTADGDIEYQCDRCVIPMGSEDGWEGAVFDHFQAVVSAIGCKLRLGKRQATLGESVGGSTYHFDIWKGHPYYDDVLGLLQRNRDVAVALRRKVESYNEAHTPDERTLMRITSYVGQFVMDTESEEEES